jgi:hypothetical protein
VVPLHEEGYGHLIERTVLGARRLHAALAAADLAGARAVMLPHPDINIVNYVVRPPDAPDLAAINAFNETLYARLSQAPGARPPEYYVTRTRLLTPTYDGAIGPLLEELGGVTREEWAAPGGGLVVLRMTVMDPWLAEGSAPDHVAGFVRHLAALCAELRGAPAPRR